MKVRLVSKKVERGLRVLATPLRLAIASGQAPHPKMMRNPDAQALAAALEWLGDEPQEKE